MELYRTHQIFDGNGNGVQVSWFKDGRVSSAGYWTADTARKGRWNFYHTNGAVKASVDYADGKEKAIRCFDESGKQLDSAACIEKEAEFDGGARAWQNFVARTLDTNVPVKKGAPSGQFTVAVRFIVNTDGTLSDFSPVTSTGFGMEDELIRILKRSPKWLPAQQYGRKVRAYRI